MFEIQRGLNMPENIPAAALRSPYKFWQIPEGGCALVYGRSKDNVREAVKVTEKQFKGRRKFLIAETVDDQGLPVIGVWRQSLAAYKANQ
jgi:hypothetical protein